MARRPRNRKSSSSLAARVLLIGAFATTFVAGVLVGQHLMPRPVAESFTAATLEEVEEAESLQAPVPERVFTFYDRLPGEQAGTESRAEAAPALPAAEPEPEPEPAVRSLVREERVPEAAPPAVQQPVDEPPQTRVLSRGPSAEAGNGTTEEVPGRPPEGVVSAAAPPAPSEAAPDAPARPQPVAPVAEMESQDGGNPASAEAPTARRVLSRAPVQAAGGLEGEVTSASSWEEAQSIRSLLSAQGMETAVITVDEPGTGRRLAVLVRPGEDIEGRVSAARRVLAEANR